MGYGNPIQTITYPYVDHDFGAGALASSFKGPDGLTGRLRELTVVPTETFTDDTASAKVRIGTSGDADAYAEADLGTAASGDTYVASFDDPDWVNESLLPRDTQIEVAGVSPTGGTPAGIATVLITVDWY